MRDEFKKWFSVPTRFRDLDPMNHVNRSIYFVYFEMARTEYFKDMDIAGLREEGKSEIPVVSQTCNYRQQVFHFSTLDVGIRCTELRKKTVHLAYEIYLEDTDTLVAGWCLHLRLGRPHHPQGHPPPRRSPACH